MKKYIFFLSFVIIFLQFDAAYAQDTPVRIKNFVSKNKVYIGERLNYRLLIRSPKTTQVKLPKFGIYLGDFQIKKSYVGESTFFWQKNTKVILVLNSLTVGENKIPQLEIGYKDAGKDTWAVLKTQDFKIEVMDIIIPKAFSIMPQAGPIGIWHIYGFVIGGVFFIILLCALSFLAFLIIKSIKNRPIQQLGADELALKTLSQLEASYSNKNSSEKDYYSAIVDVLREYLERRYNINASKMTTQQFTQAIAKIRDIKQDYKKPIIEFLNTKDKIRFAGEDISQGATKPLLAFVRQFILGSRESA